MSAFKLSDTLSISKEEAQAIIDKFFKVVPKVQSFLNALGNLAKKRGYIRTGLPFGRIRFFEGYNERSDLKRQGEIERAGKNQPIQGSNGDIIKQALVSIKETIDDNNYPVFIINSIYDEILTECEDSFAEEWKLIMDDLMIKAAQVVLKETPVVVDCQISEYWKK